MAGMARIAAVVAVVLTASACGSTSFEVSFGGGSGTVEEAATFLIEGELADQVGAPLIADCPEVPDPEVGTEFTCTGTTEQGDVITFAGIVDREDHIDLNSTNLIVADRVAAWEDGVAASVGETLGFAVTVDCGDRFVVLDETGEIPCRVTDEFGEQARLVVTVTDLDEGDFSWAIE